MKIYVNKVKCRRCGDVIESKHRHDFKWCNCGSVGIDGGKDYLRRSAKDSDDILELSEYGLDFQKIKDRLTSPIPLKEALKDVEPFLNEDEVVEIERAIKDKKDIK